MDAQTHQQQCFKEGICSFAASHSCIGQQKHVTSRTWERIQFVYAKKHPGFIATEPNSNKFLFTAILTSL